MLRPKHEKKRKPSIYKNDSAKTRVEKKPEYVKDMKNVTAKARRFIARNHNKFVKKYSGQRR